MVVTPYLSFCLVTTLNPYLINSDPCLFESTNFLNDLIIAEDVSNSNTNGKNEWITPRKQYHINVILLVIENKQ